MSEKEKEEKDKLNFKVISSDTSVKVPTDSDEKDEAVKDLIALLKPKIEAPKPVSPKPLSLGAKKVKPIQFSPTNKPKPIGFIRPSAKTQKPTIKEEVESEILISKDSLDEEASEDLVKMQEILQGIKEDEIAEREEETKVIDIPDEKQIIGIQVECPHCGRKILLDQLEFLKQGYSDYCPKCNLMLLPNILPEDYEPIESSETKEE